MEQSVYRYSRRPIRLVTRAQSCLDDAAEKQARAERFACLYGKPGPVADDALAELLAWRATGELSERDDIAESRMKRLLGEKLTDEEGKALRDWHRQR